MEVSALDLRILRYLLEYGMLESERGIARSLRVSPSTLSFKLRKFEDMNIITAYRYRVDFRRLGFNHMAWIRLRPKYGRRTMDEYMAALLEHPEVHVCVFTSGSKNFAIKSYGRSRKELTALVRRVSSSLGISRNNIEVFHVQRQLKAHNKIMADHEAKWAPDKTDFAIIAKKMQEPKESLVWIAKKLGLHRNTVNARWKGLLAGGVIIKKTPIINTELYRQIGIHCMAMHIFRPKRGCRERLCRHLIGMPEVHELNVTDKGEVLAIIRTKDLDSYFSLTSKFLTEKGVAGNIEKSLFNIIIASDSRRHTYLKDLGINKMTA